MHLFVVGLNHHTAPIEVRERLAIPDYSLEPALAALAAREGVREGTILSTCNRTEVYAVTERRDESDILAAFLSEHRKFPVREFQGHLFTHRDDAAVSHLMRVASGLDSLVLGEPQILGQVRAAYSAAVSAGTAGSLTHSLFRAAVAAGKRARTETEIGHGGFSVGHAAVDLARSIFGSLDDAGILILGAGKMSELTARHLVASGIKAVLVANRTYEKAVAIAQRFGGEAIHYTNFPEALVHTDILISSTAAPHPIVTRESLQQTLRRRRGRPLFLVDIAVPRDIDSDVASLDNVFLYDLDDLQEVVADMARDRAAEVQAVETIVAEETRRFMEWWRSLDAVPVVTQLREKHERIRALEVERLRHQLPDLSNHAWEKIEAATRSMLNRVARDPIAQIKAAAHDPSLSRPADLLDAARQIFALEDPLPPNGAAPITSEPPLMPTPRPESREVGNQVDGDDKEQGV